MKKIHLMVLCVLCGCQGVVVPEVFTYREIQTNTYRLASWQKITDTTKPVRIYIEGDGHAFNHWGYPTANPTPQSVFLRKIAFNDPNANVVYLARPCQYVDDQRCTVKDWTTGRFSQEIVDSTALAIKEVASARPVVLVGYSGGALLSGLIIKQNSTLHVTKWITVAGVLNHKKWTEDLNLPPLKDSIDLDKLPTIPQLHLVGDKDKVVSYKLTKSLANKKDVIVVPKATHDCGYEEYYSIIYE
ncbi:MAG: hypothetical protein II938_00705 [Alphaproteobacteria bacterium]|nr:hypothetical protein [Alphaproteobacteria bacterium]